MAPMFATQPKMRKTMSPLARQLIPLVDASDPSSTLATIPERLSDDHFDS